MQSYPKISVITPSFNSAPFLESAIRSVLEQRYPNLEFIVIDGGSTDGSVDTLRHYHSALTYWVSEPDAGQYAAINRGFSQATGDILCWLNADDLLLPNALNIIAEIFTLFPSVDWLSSLRPGTWDADGHLVKLDTLPGFSKAAFLDGLYLPTMTYKGYWLQQESTFWRRSLWQKIGGELPRASLAGDFALWCAFYKYTELVGLEYPLAGFRTVQGQRSEAVGEYMQESKAALENLRLFWDWHPNSLTRARYSSLMLLPQMKYWAQEHLGYSGQRITKKNPKIANSGWDLSSHHFLP